MAGKTQAYKPFGKQPPRHLLQHSDTPPVDLDQIVIGGENVRDPLLLNNARDSHWDQMNMISVKRRVGCSNVVLS
ncbi:hypothetical protein D9M68_914820 [compost metagenome]